MSSVVITVALVIFIWIIIVAASSAPGGVVIADTLFEEDSADESTLDDVAQEDVPVELILLVVRLEINVMLTPASKSEDEAPIAA